MPDNVVIPWLLADIDDVEAVDFEEPLASSNNADHHDLHRRYREALEDIGGDTNTREQAGRVFSMLESICGMHFRADEP